VLGDVARQLRDFNLVLKFAFEAGEEDLPLARFEPVHQRGDGPHAVVDREVDQLLVHEVVVGKLLDVVRKRVLSRGREPRFALVCEFLAEGQFDGLVVFAPRVLEVDLVLLQVAEVLLGLFGGRRAQTLVVLYVPVGNRLLVLLPLVVLLNCEETVLLLTLSRFYDRGDELFQEFGVIFK